MDATLPAPIVANPTQSLSDYYRMQTAAQAPEQARAQTGLIGAHTQLYGAQAEAARMQNEITKAQLGAITQPLGGSRGTYDPNALPWEGSNGIAGMSPVMQTGGGGMVFNGMPMPANIAIKAAVDPAVGAKWATETRPAQLRQLVLGSVGSDGQSVDLPTWNQNVWTAYQGSMITAADAKRLYNNPTLAQSLLQSTLPPEQAAAVQGPRSMAGVPARVIEQRAAPYTAGPTDQRVAPAMPTIGTRGDVLQGPIPMDPQAPQRIADGGLPGLAGNPPGPSIPGGNVPEAAPAPAPAPLPAPGTPNGPPRLTPDDQERFKQNNELREGDIKELPLIQGAATTAGSAQSNLLQVKPLVEKAITGSFADQRTAAANLVRTFAPNMVQSFLEKADLIKPDSPGATQELNKLLFNNVTNAEQQMGAGNASVRIGAMLTKLTAQANPNIEMQPDAILKMTNMMLVRNQLVKDFASGAQSYFDNASDAVFKDPRSKYSGLNSYQKMYIDSGNPQSVETYVAATQAINKEPFAVWSKGLNKAQINAVGSIVFRADPAGGGLMNSGGTWVPASWLARNAQ